jgi:hypothetical protein
MDSLLKERIERVRQVLTESDDPSIGFLAPPCEHDSFPPQVPLSYQHFLRAADGAVCGQIILHESDELLRKQTTLHELPGGKQRWFCIGSIDEKIVVMDLRLDAVHVVDPEEKFDPDDALGSLDYFLSTYVFGLDYAELVFDAEDDLWYRMLKSLEI